MLSKRFKKANKKYNPIKKHIAINGKMIKAIVLSDTHGNVSDLLKLKQILQEADMVLFAGDGDNDFSALPKDIYDKTKIVAGNCDYTHYPKEIMFKAEGHKILLCHGDRFHVKSGLTSLYYYAKENSCDIVIYGHTHANKILKFDDILFINPGNLQKYSTEKTFCYLVINDKCVVATINDSFFHNSL